MRSRRQGLPERVNLLRAVADLSSDNRETVATALGPSCHARRGETPQLFELNLWSPEPGVPQHPAGKPADSCLTTAQRVD
ncbi:hypothetical protein [Deinococcus sp.]|uniref:hypothetical protein n=1 Tax=Deinococcus sp. TaxID=47478 RepID=UPI00391DA6E7